MSCTISFNNLGNGQELALPVEITGRIVSPDPANVKLLTVSRQIDDNALQDISASCSPVPSNAEGGPIDFAFELTAAECPLPDTYYMLTVYCWDSQDEAVTMASITFKTANPYAQPTPIAGPTVPPRME